MAWQFTAALMNAIDKPYISQIMAGQFTATLMNANDKTLH